MKLRHFGLRALAAVFLMQAGVSRSQQNTVLVRDGKSAYSIVRAANAPSSVRHAADELQWYIEQSTGAKLPLVTSAAVLNNRFISVGDTAAARKSGLMDNAIPLEGFRIATRGGNIFIYGPDTADKELTPQRGTSNGTANGVYTVLEDYFNVRWLLPGEMGVDIPKLKAVAIPVIDRTEAPAFPSRTLTSVQNEKESVKEWQRHLKLGNSISVKHSHSWAQIIPPSLFEQHPEWFAEIGGKRTLPIGDRYKIETTNPELVQYFADTTIKFLQERPDRFTASLSATDSANWSESVASKALYDKDPRGKLSVTPLMLKFYNDVAKAVGKTLPDRMVAGYIYADHLYPPSTGIPPLEPNFFPVLATSISYGYQLYRPSVQKEWDQLFQAWGAKTSNLGYYDLPNFFKGGYFTPPAPEILNFIFPRLAKYNVKHLDITSNSTWGQSGVKNYLFARLMWNPKLDANAVAHEFYVRAYGAEAGLKVEQIYQGMDEAIKHYYNKDQGIAYTASPAYVREVLGVQYPHVEKLYLEAEKAAEKATPQQRARLQLFGQHVMLMQWQVRDFGVYPNTTTSPLYRSNTQLAELLKGDVSGFGIENAPAVGITKAEKVYTPVKVELLPKLANPQTGVTAPNVFSTIQANRILFYPTADSEIQIKPVRVANQVDIVRYGIYDAFGKNIQNGVMNTGEIIRFTTSEKQVYYLDIESTTARFEMEFRGAPFAIHNFTDPGKRGLRFDAKTSPIYFYVAASLREFHLTVNTSSPGETSLNELYSPSGKLVQTLDTQTTPGVKFSANADTSPGDWEGFWCLSPKKAPTGRLGTVNIKFDPALSQWVVTDPNQPLKISELK